MYCVKVTIMVLHLFLQGPGPPRAGSGPVVPTASNRCFPIQSYATHGYLDEEGQGPDRRRAWAAVADTPSTSTPGSEKREDSTRLLFVSQQLQVLGNGERHASSLPTLLKPVQGEQSGKHSLSSSPGTAVIGRWRGRRHTLKIRMAIRMHWSKGGWFILGRGSELHNNPVLLFKSTATTLYLEPNELAAFYRWMLGVPSHVATW